MRFLMLAGGQLVEHHFRDGMYILQLVATSKDSGTLVAAVPLHFLSPLREWVLYNGSLGTTSNRFWGWKRSFAVSSGLLWPSLGAMKLGTWKMACAQLLIFGLYEQKIAWGCDGSFFFRGSRGKTEISRRLVEGRR
jgi:hypothetical protein